MRRVAVIGTGAMGGGVVASLVRAGIPTIARDIRPEAQQRAVACGATGATSAADAARNADIVIVLVVDAPQVETVLFDNDGVAGAMAQGGIVLVSSTVAPHFVAATAGRLAAQRLTLVDAPVSGGPAKAAAGTMTMMLSGAQEAVAAVRGVLEPITGALFVIGTRPGEAATMKVVNNLLAAANLAAAAEALTIARRAGLDVAQAARVIAASSGASWIAGDRVPRALAGDLAPRAATRVLHKDVGLAVDLANELGVPGEFAHAAREAFAHALAAGYAEDDDAAMFVAAARRAGLHWP